MTLLVLLSATIISLLAGIYFGIRAKRQAEFFWTYLIIGLIFTSPIMLGGYTWYDEFYSAGLLLPMLSKFNRDTIKVSNLVFSIFCIYLFFQAIRGIAYFTQFGIIETLTKIRWLFFFVIILLVHNKGRVLKSAVFFNKTFAHSLTKAGFIFNLIYLSIGLISIYTFGSTAYTQFAQLSASKNAAPSAILAIFGATAYIVPVYIAFVPAALITIKYDVASRSKLAWLTLALSLTTQLLYNSRSGFLIISIFIILFLLQYSWKLRVVQGLLTFIPLISLAFVFQMYFNEVRTDVIYQDMLNTLHISTSSNKKKFDAQDIQRKIWNISAIQAISDNPINLVFGYGLRTSGFIVAPYVFKLLSRVRENATYNEAVGTPGFANLAVDTGALGLFLLLVLFLICLIKISKVSGNFELFLLFSPVAFILQLFVINIFDVLLFYLALMPGGLCFILALCNKKY
jgi:hypothetical protein